MNTNESIDVQLAEGKVFRFKNNRSYILAFDKGVFTAADVEKLNKAFAKFGIHNVVTILVEGEPDKVMRMFEDKSPREAN